MVGIAGRVVLGNGKPEQKRWSDARCEGEAIRKGCTDTGGLRSCLNAPHDSGAP